MRKTAWNEGIISIIMILVTGGTGFIGQKLIRQLIAVGKPVRTLLRPSLETPNLPRSVSVDVAVSSLNDERSLSAAMKGVSVVFHLAGSERRGIRADFSGVDIDGTRMVSRMAAQAGVRRIFYLSHLGADRSSAYALLKSKAIAEGLIIQSGVPYTIIRSGLVFGPGDQFVTSLAKLIHISPLFFLMPGDGSTLLQPLWIEDLITVLTMDLDDFSGDSRIIRIGGGETFSFKLIVEMIMKQIKINRKFVSLPPPYIRSLAVTLEQANRRFPISVHFLDYLAADRTCALDSLPRLFGIIPARFGKHLDFLNG